MSLRLDWADRADPALTSAGASAGDPGAPSGGGAASRHWKVNLSTPDGTHSVSAEIAALIQRLATGNHDWGYQRIQGELLKPGYRDRAIGMALLHHAGLGGRTTTGIVAPGRDTAWAAGCSVTNSNPIGGKSDSCPELGFLDSLMLRWNGKIWQQMSVPDVGRLNSLAGSEGNM